MTWNIKEFNKQKTLFRSYYCAGCRQVKPCQLLDQSECCACIYQNEQERAAEYSNYRQVYQRKEQEQKDRIQQLQLLRNYSGCPQCGSLAVDAYSLYENSQLVCQPCRMGKEGGSSGPISFTEQQKWYKKWWKIDLTEWLEREGVYSEPSQNFSQLPVNAECAREWIKDKEHLKNCNCLEKEAKNLVDLFISSLKEYQDKLKECKCEISNKPRTPYYDWANYGYTYCEKCEATTKGAGKHGVIKNRNNPSFWGLEIKEKVLCLECLKQFQEKMSASKKYTFNKYLKRGY